MGNFCVPAALQHCYECTTDVVPPTQGNRVRQPGNEGELTPCVWSVPACRTVNGSCCTAESLDQRSTRSHRQQLQYARYHRSACVNRVTSALNNVSWPLDRGGDVYRRICVTCIEYCAPVQQCRYICTHCFAFVIACGVGALRKLLCDRIIVLPALQLSR
jgi:hypothetical protein